MDKSPHDNQGTNGRDAYIPVSTGHTSRRFPRWLVPRRGFWYVLILSFAVPTFALAAISYDNAVVSLVVNATPNSTSLAVANSSNRFLTACIFDTGGDILSGITATKGGVQAAMTQILKRANSTEELYCYGIVNEDSGTVTVTASFSASTISRMTVSSYDGVSQSTVIGSMTTSNGAGTAASLTGTLTNPSSNDWDVLWVRAGDNLSAGTGSTERPSAQNTTSTLFDSNGGVSGSNSMSATIATSQAYAYIMFAMEPVVTASTPYYFGYYNVTWW